VRSAGSGAAVAMEDAKRRLRMLVGAQKDSDGFINYYANSDQSTLERFVDEIQLTLFFGDVIKSLTTALSRGQYISLPFRVVDGFIQWFSYIYIICYPFMLFVALGFIIGCY